MKQYFRPVFVILIALQIVFCQKIFAQNNQQYSRAELYNKILGSLVGSAIGDAMGAPYEMWPREDIAAKRGYINKLDTVFRDISPEGVWKRDLPPGGTTDDTRFKKLIINYLIKQNSNKKLSDKKLAQHIIHDYNLYAKQIPVDSTKLDWLIEWVKIARPFAKNDFLKYQQNLIKFYGGDLACGGLLYSPIIGLYYPSEPEKAYNEAYNLALWDQGYARDLTAIAAAMVSAAMEKTPNRERILMAFDQLDPQGFHQTRLLGRLATGILNSAKYIVKMADSTDIGLEINAEKIYRIKQETAFKLLHAQNEKIPFHAGEIMLQITTAMLFTDFDFEKTIAFLVNNARDNDTNSAIAGAVLGAMVGFNKLPNQMKTQVLFVNKNILENDLELFANQLTNKVLERKNLR